MELHIKTNKCDQVSSSPPKEELPCIPILLSILMGEYEQERARSERIDNKAIGLLTIIIALITVYVPIFPFEKIIGIYSKFEVCSAMTVIFSLFLLAGLIAAFLAVRSSYKIIEVYKTREYRAVNTQAFNTNEKLAQTTSDGFQVDLIDHYQSIIAENSKINTDKADILGNQFRNVIIIFALLSISAVGTLIIAGS